MTIYDLLKKKGTEVYTINQDDVVCKALEMLNTKHIGALMVMDGEKVAGIMTERDILKHLYQKQGYIKGTKIKELMTPMGTFIRADKNDGVKQVMEVMTLKKVRHMPIFDGDKLVGMISIGDMVKEMLEIAENENEQLKNYISGGY